MWLSEEENDREMFPSLTGIIRFLMYTMGIMEILDAVGFRPLQGLFIF